MDKLLNCSYDNTPKFSLDGKTLESKCIDIYDGDSATFAVIVNGELYKFKRSEHTEGDRWDCNWNKNVIWQCKGRNKNARLA